MADSTRKHLGLTQERLASWLHVTRTALADVETNRRGLPLGHWIQDARLDMAALGRVFDVSGTSAPGPPPLPPPPPERDPLVQRLDYCQHHARRLRRALEMLRRRAAPYEARLVALPSLRAWAGPVRDPEREANWLALFAGEADVALRYDCGAGPQRLLEARLAGLEREAELLEETLAAHPPKPPAP